LQGINHNPAGAEDDSTGLSFHKLRPAVQVAIGVILVISGALGLGTALTTLLEWMGEGSAKELNGWQIVAHTASAVLSLAILAAGVYAVVERIRHSKGQE